MNSNPDWPRVRRGLRGASKAQSRGLPLLRCSGRVLVRGPNEAISPYRGSRRGVHTIFEGRPVKAGTDRPAEEIPELVATLSGRGGKEWKGWKNWAGHSQGSQGSETETTLRSRRTRHHAFL